MAPRQRSSPTPSSGIDDIDALSSSSSNNSEKVSLVHHCDDKLLTTSKSCEKQRSLDSTIVNEPIIAGNAAAAERARDLHDYFNLVALLPIIATTAINWDFLKLPQGPEVAYVGKYFMLNWTVTLIYFIIDLSWVSAIPESVKSPGTIIKHHIVAILYLSCPLIWPDYSWIMGGLLSVEMNTWFLIMRRVALKNHEKIPGLAHAFITSMFYLTWIVIRMGIYPAIMYKFLWMAYDDFIRNGLMWHYEYLVLPTHFFLCLLNLKWSYELFMPFLTRQPARDYKKTVVDGL